MASGGSIMSKILDKIKGNEGCVLFEEDVQVKPPERKKLRTEDKRKDPNQPTSFVFHNKYDRNFHYIKNDGESADIKISIDLPVEIYIEKQYKILKKPSLLDDKIIIAAPVSGEEIVIDWKNALEERIDISEGSNEKRSASVKDDVETYIGLVFMWRELAKQIKKGEIDAPTAFRKQNNLLHMQEQFPDLTAYIEREIKIFEPITDNRLHGVIVRYGDPSLKEAFERFPTDREIMSKLGIKTDYGRRAIVRTFGISVERFLELWKDADTTIDALNKFQETEETRLISCNEVVKDVALDMVAALKTSVTQQKEAQWQWQNAQLDKIWKVMFPTSARPVSDWETLRKDAV